MATIEKISIFKAATCTLMSLIGMLIFYYLYIAVPRFYKEVLSSLGNDLPIPTLILHKGYPALLVASVACVFPIAIWFRSNLKYKHQVCCFRFSFICCLFAIAAYFFVVWAMYLPINAIGNGF
jgi:hypothetical protein